MNETLMSLEDLALSMIRGGDATSDFVAKFTDLQKRTADMRARPSGEFHPVTKKMMSCGEVLDDSHCSGICTAGPNGAGQLTKEWKELQLPGTLLK